MSKELQQIIDILTDPKGDIATIKEHCKEMSNHLKVLNGRVTKLELHEEQCPIQEVKRDTDIIRFFVRHPKVFYFMAVIIGTVISINGMELIIKLIKLIM